MRNGDPHGIRKALLSTAPPPLRPSWVWMMVNGAIGWRLHSQRVTNGQDDSPSKAGRRMMMTVNWEKLGFVWYLFCGRNAEEVSQALTSYYRPSSQRLYTESTSSRRRRSACTSSSAAIAPDLISLGHSKRNFPTQKTKIIWSVHKHGGRSLSEQVLTSCSSLLPI